MKKYKCDNCGRVWKKITCPLYGCSNLRTRLDPGSIVPDGECSDCGAFIYRVKEEGGTAVNFKDGPHMSAADKELLLRQWKTFLDEGCQLRYFTIRLYDHLHLCCRYGDHHNRHRFYYAYFEDTRSMQAFFRQFDNEKGNTSLECGTKRWYTDIDCHDINKAMCDYFTENRDKVFRYYANIINLGIYGIKIELSGDDGTLSSDFPSIADVGDTEEDREALLIHAASLAGIESLILAAACAGIEVSSPRFKQSITTAVKAVDNISSAHSEAAKRCSQ